MSETTIYTIVAVIVGGISAFLGYIGGRDKNKATAERTIGDAWDKYAANLEAQLATVTGRVNTLTQMVGQQNQTIAEQNSTIAAQNGRIAAQDQIIAEQRVTIKDLTTQNERMSCQIEELGGTPPHKKGK